MTSKIAISCLLIQCTRKLLTFDIQVLNKEQFVWHWYRLYANESQVINLQNSLYLFCIGVIITRERVLYKIAALVYKVHSTVSPTCLAADLSVLLAPTVWQCLRSSGQPSSTGLSRFSVHEYRAIYRITWHLPCCSPHFVSDYNVRAVNAATTLRSGIKMIYYFKLFVKLSILATFAHVQLFKIVFWMPKIG